MKITGLHIYGFGQFQDFQLQFTSNFQLIYGENEAGKSTLLAFIYAILFRFPTKSNRENRYFPKDGHKYGGRLFLQTSKYGKVIVERVYEQNKASGVVQLLLDDGKKANDRLLRELLGGMNKELFKAIYASDLSGVQKIEQLTAEEIGNYLLSAGIVGSSRLKAIQQFLMKRQAELYKPNGRKPELNTKLTKLAETNEELSKLQKKNDSYYLMNDKMKALSDNVQQLNEQQTWQKKELRRLEIMEQAVPMLKKRRELVARFQQLGDLETFPEDAIERYRIWQEKIVEVTSDLEFYENELHHLSEQINHISINEEILKHEYQIEKIIMEQEQFRSYHYELDDLEEKVGQLSNEVLQMLSKLGKAWTEEAVKNAITNLSTKEHLNQLQNKRDKLKQQQVFLDGDMEQKLEQLEQLEQKEQLLKKKLFTEKEKHHYRLLVKQCDEYQNLIDKRDKITDQISFYKNNSARKKENKLFPILLIIVGIVTASWWVYSGEWILGLLLAISLIGTGVYSMKIAPQQIVKDDSFQYLQDELAAINQRLKQIPNPIDEEELTKIQHLLLVDEQLSNDYLLVTERLADAKQAYTKIITKYDNWEKESGKLLIEMQKWKEKNNFPSSTSDFDLKGQLELVIALQDKYHQLDETSRRLSSIRGKLTQHKTEINKLNDTINNQGFHSKQDSLKQMEAQLNQAKENLVVRREMESKSTLIKDTINKLQERKRQYEKECFTLLQKAEADTEDELVERAKKSENSRSLQKQLQLLNAQLESSLPAPMLEELENMEILDDIFIKKQRILDELARTEVELESLTKEVAEIKAKINQMEEEGTYSQTLQQFEIERNEIREVAKNWMTYRVAEHLVNQTKRKYQEERLPKVIELASIYFSRLTNGNYRNIYFSENDKDCFIVESKDKQRYTAFEISRGTAEQLYLAIRLAVGSVYRSIDNWPLILDDILVNFDENRTHATFALLREISQKHQVIFLTCHRHNLQQFRKSDTIYLETKQKTSILVKHIEG